MFEANIYSALRNRRSIRKYLQKDIPKSVLKRVLDAARWAPSAHNTQPWRFIIINDSTVKMNLAEAMASEWNKDLIKNGFSPDERENLVRASVKTFTNSPALIVACLTMENMDKYPDKRRQNAEYLMGVQSVAAAIQNLLLAAHAEGLGACWFCAPLFCQHTVKEVLKLPENIEPQALITIGYPAETPKTPRRKPLKSILHVNYWEEAR
ncbi:MAG: nitroreductase family protein [Candidatus Bathyarchaeia archaeon]